MPEHSLSTLGNAPLPPPPRLGGVAPECRPTGGSTGTGKDKPFLVLVVDDSLASQELSALYLREAWQFERVLELDFAADGAEALAKLRTKRFALVVLDWMLPVLGKGGVLRHLRQHGIRIPVVVISSTERADINVDLAALQAAFLHKSQMTPATLLIAIAHAVTLLGLQWTANPVRSCAPNLRRSDC